MFTFTTILFICLVLLPKESLQKNGDGRAKKSGIYRRGSRTRRYGSRSLDWQYCNSPPCGGFREPCCQPGDQCGSEMQCCTGAPPYCYAARNTEGPYPTSLHSSDCGRRGEPCCNHLCCPGVGCSYNSGKCPKR